MLLENLHPCMQTCLFLCHESLFSSLGLLLESLLGLEAAPPGADDNHEWQEGQVNKEAHPKQKLDGSTPLLPGKQETKGYHRAVISI